MKKSSWVVLGVCGALLALLGFLYVQSHQTPADLTPQKIEVMLNDMKSAVAHKNLQALMKYIDPGPDTRISNLNTDQLRTMLSRAFLQSEQLVPSYSNLNVHNDGEETLADFSLSVNQHLAEGSGDDYHGHVTLFFRRVEVSHLLGLYHTKEWRIVRADSTGPDLQGYGDY